MTFDRIEFIDFNEELDEEHEGKLTKGFLLKTEIEGDEYWICFILEGRHEWKMKGKCWDGERFIEAEFRDDAIYSLTKYLPENPTYIRIGADLLEIARQFYAQYGADFHKAWEEDFGHLVPNLD